MSGVPFERPLDLRRDGRRRRDVRALHLETVLVRQPRDADLLAVRSYVRVLALRDDWRLVVHVLRLARFLMTDPVARLEANMTMEISVTIVIYTIFLYDILNEMCRHV